MTVGFATSAEISTALEVVQFAAGESKQTIPTTLDSSTSDIKAWLYQLNRTGKDLRSKFLWPNLNKRFTYSTSEDEPEQLLPEDFDRAVFDTFWQSSEYRGMLGPLTAREWEAQKNGIAESYPYFQFRLIGDNPASLTLFPSDISSGEEIVFQYQSTNWLRPSQIWTSEGSVSANEYIYYGKRIYKCSASATLGTSAPSHQIGSATNGSATLTHSKYDRVIENNTVCLLDTELLVLGTQFRWLRIQGYEYKTIEDEYNRQINKKIGALTGAGQFTIGSGGGNYLFNWNNVPMTGWGGES